MYNFYKETEVKIIAYEYRKKQIYSAIGIKDNFSIVTDEAELDFKPTSLTLTGMNDILINLCRKNKFIALDLLDAQNSHCFILYLDRGNDLEGGRMRIIDSFVSERKAEVRDFDLDKFYQYLYGVNQKFSCELFNCEDPIYLANWMLIIGYVD